MGKGGRREAGGNAFAQVRVMVVDEDIAVETEITPRFTCVWAERQQELLVDWT